MLKIKHNTYPQLTQRLDRTKKALPGVGDRWSREAIALLKYYLIDHLENQGRGGQPPPLSDATRKIYRSSGRPDGSGIRNHIMINHYRERGKSYTTLGIPRGKPTMVAKVQEHGAVIRVTPKMRGYLATLGIYLRADTGTIQIPARRFWSTSNLRAKAEAKALLRKLLRQA